MPRPDLKLDDFVPDRPFEPRRPIAQPPIQDLIEGVSLTPLLRNEDSRGALTVLLTTHDGPIDPIVHVYQVSALPGSVRAWVYHARQDDRLAFTTGSFQVVLYDIREGSRTRHMLNKLILGSERPTLLRIPAFVVHGVKNIGPETATFLNMPTTAYDPAWPDKCRLPADDPRVPYSF